MGRNKRRRLDLPFDEGEPTKLYLKCPGCREEYYIIDGKAYTEVMDGKRELMGADLTMVPEYGPEGHNWSNNFSDHSTSWAICCPNCDSPYGESLESMEVVER